MKSGDSMSYEELKNKFNIVHKLKFKLYSLEYNVELVNDKVEIYAIFYENRKNYYNSFDDVNDTIRMYNFVHFYITFFVHSYCIINN